MTKQIFVIPPNIWHQYCALILTSRSVYVTLLHARFVVRLITLKLFIIYDDLILFIFNFYNTSFRSSAIEYLSKSGSECGQIHARQLY